MQHVNEKIAGMCILSKRLEEERKRLGLNQDEMAVAGGISKRTYCYYESGEREPGSSFLTAIAAAGADVLYILTGTRSCPSDAEPLTRDEAFVLETYRFTDEAGKTALRTTLSAFAQSKRVKESGKKAG